MMWMDNLLKHLLDWLNIYSIKRWEEALIQLRNTDKLKPKDLMFIVIFI